MGDGCVMFRANTLRFLMPAPLSGDSEVSPGGRPELTSQGRPQLRADLEEAGLCLQQ